MCEVDKGKEYGWAIDFSDQLLDVSLVYVLHYIVISAPPCKKVAQFAVATAQLCSKLPARLYNSSCPT